MIVQWVVENDNLEIDAFCNALTHIEVEDIRHESCADPCKTSSDLTLNRLMANFLNDTHFKLEVTYHCEADAVAAMLCCQGGQVINENTIDAGSGKGE